MFLHTKIISSTSAKQIAENPIAEASGAKLLAQVCGASRASFYNIFSFYKSIEYFLNDESIL